MNKTNIILINIGVIVVILGIIVWVFSSKQPISTTPNQNNPTTNNTPNTPLIKDISKPTKNPTTTVNDLKAETLSIKTADNTIISVDNFYKSPYTKVFDPQNDAIIKEDINYSIIYYFKYQSFYITLKGGDLHNVRFLAEESFLKKLNITQNEACQLYVSLNVPTSVNEKAAGTDYGLSFCPSGVELPKNL